MKALFDTNILIDYLNGITAAKEEIDQYSTIIISTITWMEVLVGATPENEALTRKFLSRFKQIPVSPAIAEQAITVRRGQKIKLPDAIIKATAQIEEALLISRNTKDFPPDSPNVRVPYYL